MFEGATIRGMAGHFERLLERIAENTADQAIGKLPLLTEAERRQLVEEWKPEQRGSIRGKPASMRYLRRRWRKWPEAIALVFQEEQVTYRELNERANQLGHYLRELGVGPEVRVGFVCGAFGGDGGGAAGDIEGGWGLCAAGSSRAQPRG